MHNFIVQCCGNLVKNLGATARISCECLSSAITRYITHPNVASAKASFITILSPHLSAWYSTEEYARLSLYEHYFYPVSTGTTIRTTRFKS